MAFRLFRTKRSKIWSLLLVSLAACAAGVAYAVMWGSANDGMRGGVIALALSFLYLFTSTPNLALYLEAPDEDGNPRFDELEPKDQISRLRSAMTTAEDEKNTENWFLAITSVSGTLVAGFGDLLAQILGACP